MADNDTPQSDKTEDATPERREDAREKGQLVVSKELTSVFVLAASCMFLTFMAPRLMDGMRRLFTNQFEAMATRRIDAGNVLTYFGQVWQDTLVIIIPVFGVTLVASTAITFAQTRLNWSWDRLSPDFSRMEPMAGLKRMFSMQAVVELLKSFAKMAAVGGVGYLILKSEWVKVPELMSYPILSTWKYWGKITQQLFWSVSGLLLLIGGGDYFYNWISMERQMRMTKQEVKEEYKQRESDPQVKARMRRMQRDMLSKKTLDKTKTATVLITNPTHFSVALRYEPGMPAPIVVAKGIDFLALRMREVAKELKIPIIENRPLARELYASVKEGQEIPDKLYKAVAEIIRYVFKLKGRTIARKTEAKVDHPAS